MKAVLTCCVCIVLHGCSGYDISSCGTNGTIDLEATPTSTLTCTGITDDTMSWYFTRSDSTSFVIGTCTWSTSSCSTGYATYVANRMEYNTSTLVITQNHTHSIDGTVTCGRNQSNSSSASCKVHVVPASTTTPQTGGASSTARTTANNTMAGGENSNEGDKNRGDDGPPILIIAGAAGGGLVASIIIVVIVVVVVKRRGGPSREAGDIDTTEDDFEEHINHLYESSDVRPSAMTSHLQPPQNAPNPRDVKPMSPADVESETDLGYNTVSEQQAVVSTHQHDQVLDADLYSTPGGN